MIGVDKEHFQRVEGLFQEAIDLPPENRSDFLQRACGHDAALHGEVAKLLDRSDSGAAIPWIREHFDPVVDGECNGRHPQPEDRTGRIIGPYKLGRLIGEGGFGSVYLAEQERPVRRTVALKIIKLGMDTHQVIARFEAERQALAMMDHPGIARVLDAGATEQGRPYFVMELVDGVPITRYCDERTFSTTRRLELFAAVCQAVQHAHQKGVIHRDLKPSNVLVALLDGRPTPKIIDFGIAKATGVRLTENTLSAEGSHLIGTPQYMSPEQAEGGVDVDTRSDIYSLGVLLYELLTGTTPFEAHTLNGSTPDDLRRTIREVEPPRPSTRVGELRRWHAARIGSSPNSAVDSLQANDGQDKVSIERIAQQRRTEPERLRRELRGDLDWIVMKCLEKERTRRYETANGLALDIHRHLIHEPVSAGPPGAMYRLAKFVRRRRAAVLAAVICGLMLLIGLTGTTYGVFWALQERNLAQQSERQQSALRRRADDAREAAERAGDVADEQRRVAQDHAARAQSVSSFLISTLGLTDVDITQEAGMTVEALLDRAAAEVGIALADQPSAEVAVRTVIGRSYASRGQTEAADVHLARALEIQRQIGPRDLEGLYEILWPHWRVLDELGEPAGTARSLEALGVGRQIIQRRVPDLAAALEAFVGQWNRPFDRAKADELFDAALRYARNDLAQDDPLWLHVADHCQIAGRVVRNLSPEAAAAYLNEALETYRQRLPETNTQIVHTLGELIMSEIRAKRYDNAEALVGRSLELVSKVLPGDHWYAADLYCKLAWVRILQGRFEEAEALLLANHPMIVASRGTTDSAAGEAANLFVRLYEKWDRPAKADAYRMEVARWLAGRVPTFSRSALESVIGPMHPELIEAMRALGAAAREPGNDLAPRLDQVRALRQASFPDDHPVSACIAQTLNDWAVLHNQQGGPFEPHSKRLLLEVLAIDQAGGLRNASKRVSPHWQLTLHNDAIGQHDLAEAHIRQGIAILEANPPDRWGYLECCRSLLGKMLINQGRLNEAEPLLVDSFERLRAIVGETNGNTALAAGRVAELYARQGRTAQAEPYAILALQAALGTASDGGALAEDVAWQVVMLPGHTYAVYALALQAAEVAVESQPERSGWVNTLGAACYRMGQYQRALQTLERASRLREEPRISDAAFIALTLRALGRDDEAAAALQNMRTVVDAARFHSPAHRLVVGEVEAEFSEKAQ